MGWGRTLLLGDIGNRMDIGDCENDIRKLRAELHAHHSEDLTQDTQIGLLIRENAELKMYVAALIRLLMSKNVIRQDDFARFVEIIEPLLEIHG